MQYEETTEYFLSLLCLTAALTVPTSALEYDIAAPGGRVTCKNIRWNPFVTADRGELPNVDVSKNAALVPPAFVWKPYCLHPDTGILR